jgi:hypothetical protein
MLRTIQDRLPERPSLTETITRKRRWFCLLIALLFCYGCGRAEPARLPTFPVEGQVLLNNKPLANAQVVLHPVPATEGVLPATAQTDKEGKFIATTYVTGDGAVQGQFAVTVQHYPLIKNGDSYQRGPNSLPTKLATPQSTDWKITVTDSGAKLPPKKITR